ncbi:hypothetical protein I4N56_005690 [Pseudomonas mohnii]|uniref:tail fiber assembly protein n=1 Tax=Pseudomonas mohnii TaxID=395600 RepID=UPI0018DB6F08|nr:hypothetical protein [Pseudomonas mohnii]MBH8610485.1 hypothetical protein [Pseudomonas mohnii]
MKHVQFLDETRAVVMGIFASPQDPDIYQNMGEVEDDDPRYLAYMNPAPNILAIQGAKLTGLEQLADAQKVALTNRIGIINEAVTYEMASSDELVELPKRVQQRTDWGKYAVLLGRVISQTSWPHEVQWPAQPVEGMSLSVSSVVPTA